MSNNCTCDQKQRKTIYCANCHMTSREKAGSCMLHMISCNGKEAFICLECTSEGFYLKKVKNSFPTNYEIKKLNWICNWLNCNGLGIKYFLRYLP